MGRRAGRRAIATCVVAATVAAVSGCGGSSDSSSPALPKIGAARTFDLTEFEPGAKSSARTFDLSFTITQPSGKPLTSYRRGAGPHTGVHVILVRSDLGAIVHYHPPVGADGKIRERITVPTPGRYRLVVDAYPNLVGPLRNFQLFRWIRVGSESVTRPTPPFRPEVTVDGYHVRVLGRPAVHPLEASFLNVSVVDQHGRPARFTPWYGALAHAIFFRAGTLSYFHTHVCGSGTTGCATTFGPTTVTGSPSGPGRLRVGVLLPLPGTWRLFLQTRVGGHILTAPFTLKVS
jgi:hypothetical protein